MFFYLILEFLKEKKRNKSKFCCSIKTLIHLLSDVVRANKNTADCSEYEVVEIIKSWLVRSKERFYNNTRTLGSDAPKKAQTEPKKARTVPNEKQTE